MKSRKIGVLTLGVTMISFGILFMLRLFVPWFDYLYVMRFWPVVLVLLGIEVLVSAFWPTKEDAPRQKVDAVSVVLLFVMLFLVFGLASFQFALENFWMYFY